jgi:hypothetical protein
MAHSTTTLPAPTEADSGHLADEEHLTMDAALSRVLDKADDTRFWEGVRADYARLQADPEEWADYVGELAEWDATTSDGLPDE